VEVEVEEEDVSVPTLERCCPVLHTERRVAGCATVLHTLGAVGHTPAKHASSEDAGEAQGALLRTAVDVHPERATRELVRVVDVAHEYLRVDGRVAAHHGVDLRHHQIRVVAKHRRRAHRVLRRLVRA